MTSIEQLQVCGIRSFDPNPTNKQVIYFQKPLTVILGRNGAGKTTIIEALLNACTGVMPPGSGTERSSFVYDPKVVGTSEVKAQIRLVFTGKGGKLMQVIRSFQVTRNRNKMSFSTLDNTVAFQDTVSGKVISSTYRASDVDRVVPEMLGVSPAVLEHVILCHQEDCNWPLAPPKDVKRIFDDIFAATRYVLALDRLRENSKEYRRQQKEHEASLLALREHRDQAHQLEQDIAAKEERVRAFEGRSRSIEPELKELLAVSAALDTAEQNIDSLGREEASIQGRMEEKREVIRRAALPTVGQTLEQMLEIERGLADGARRAEAQVEQQSAQLTALSERARSAEERVYQTRSQLLVMERESRQHAQDTAALRLVLSTAASTSKALGMVPGIDSAVGEGNVDERSFTRVLTAAREAVAAAREEVRIKSHDAAEAMRAVEGVRQAILRETDAEAKEQEMLERAVAGLASRIQETSGAVAVAVQGGDPRRALADVQRTIAQLETRLVAAEELRRRGAAYQQRQQLLTEIDAHSRVLARLRQDLAKCKQFAGGEAELASMRARIQERSSLLTTQLMEVSGPQLEALLGRPATGSPTDTTASSLAAQLRGTRQRKEDHLASTRAEVSTLEQQAVVLEHRRSSALAELVKSEEELTAKERQCASVLDPDTAGDALDHYEATLQGAKSTAEASLKRLHTLEALSRCYDEFDTVAQDANRCATCERPFDSPDSLQCFLELNKSRQQRSPAEAAQVRAEAASATKRVRELERVEKAVGDVRVLRVSVPLVRRDIAALAEELAQNKSLRENMQTCVEDLQEQIRRLDDVAGTVVGLAALEAEVGEERRRLAGRERQLSELEREFDPHSDGSSSAAPRKTYEELLVEYEEAQEHHLNLSMQLDEEQRSRLDQSSGASSIESELQRKRAELCQLEIAVSKLADLEMSLDRQREEMEAHRGRLKVILAHREELQVALMAVDGRVRGAQSSGQRSEAEARESLTSIEEHLRAIEAAAAKALPYARGGGAAGLQTMREQVANSEAALTQLAAEREEMAAALEAVRKVISEQKTREVEVRRYVEVLQLQRSLEADAARLADVEKALQELKGGKVQSVARILGEGAEREPLPRLREMMRLKVSDLEKTRAQQQGNVEAMLQDVANLKSQLTREKYQNIEKRYRSTFLKVQTTEMAVKDIDKYYSALEKAVQSYHQEKITQINQIIADLWRQTYRGSDIDTIEIRSETENTTATAARRSYSYRVVMRRGNNELDMRGRCSAGQKVLASVVIRLALSEAFCCDCGIFALDEPTTNLDEDNARALAEALRALIETRRSVKHFQLVVITHDEQFVRALGGQSLDRFYYVHKDREGAFSVIEERTFNQLFS